MSTRVQPAAPGSAAVHGVPDAVAPPPGSPRFPLIDGVRAIAAISVLITHTAGLSFFNSANPLGAWTSRLDAGVTVFFVLSGFLLYRPWVAARLDGRPRPRPLAYARRRALRILPGYWVALTVLALAVPDKVPLVFGDHWWVYYGLLQSWSSHTILAGLGVAWSLSVEVAFYALLPVVAAAVSRWLTDRSREQQIRLELWALGLSGFVAFVVRTGVRAWDDHSAYVFTLPGLWLWFAAGMTLAVLSAGYGARPVAERPALLRSATERPWVWWLASFAALTVSAQAVGLPRAFGQPYTTFALQASYVLYPLAAVCLVAPAVFADGRTTIASRVLGNRVMAWLGLVSYGLFLYHEPLLPHLVTVVQKLPVGRHGLATFEGYCLFAAVALAVGVGCAALSYYGVERPLLRFKDARRARRPASPARP